MTGIVDFRTELLDENGNPISATNPLPTTGGGGGGGSSLADVVLQDANGVLVLQRDDGTTRTYLRLDTGLAYTPALPLVAFTTPVTGPLTNAELRAVPVPVVDEAIIEAQQDMILLLTRMLNYLNAPQGYDKSLQRYRQTAIVESGTITQVSLVPTVTTVTTVANQTNIGGVQAQLLVNAGNLSAWQASVRARIT